MMRTIIMSKLAVCLLALFCTAPQFCHADIPEDSYLVASHGQTISRVSLDGKTVQVLYKSSSGHSINTMDVDYLHDHIYFSESTVIKRMDLDGGNPMDLITAKNAVGGLALDSVTSNLYWTDAMSQSIQVVNVHTLQQRWLISTGPGSVPSAIAVDSAKRFIYWTDKGSAAKIERASLDGSDRQILHSTSISKPDDISLDHAAQKIYWTDGELRKIESSLFDGSKREVFVSFARFNRIVTLFSIALDKKDVYWTDLAYNPNTIYANSKDSRYNFSSIVPVYSGFSDRMTDIVVVHA